MKLAAFLLSAVLFGPGAHAQGAPHRLTDRTQEIELTRDVGFLVDPTARLSVEAVAALADSGRMTTVPQARIPMLRVDHGEAFWLKLQVTPDPGAPRDWLLEAGRPNVDRMQVFVGTGDGRWSGFPEAGAALPFSARLTDHRSFVYPVQLEPGRTTSFLVRVVYAGPSVPRVRLWQPAALAAADRPFLVGAGLYFGLVFGMLLYNLLLFVAVKDRGYLFYVGSGACAATAFAASSGLGAQFAWGELGPWTAKLVYASYAGASAFTSALAREFLQTRQRLPWADRNFLAMVWCGGAVAAAAFFLPTNAAAASATVLGIVSGVQLAVAATLAVVRRWPGARFFAAAWLAMYAGVLVVMGRAFGLVPYNLFVENVFAVGTALEMILLSLALADRINDEKRRREQAQSLALGVMQASQAFSLETRLERLHARVCEIIAALTGAAAVRLVLRDADLKEWFVYHEGERVPFKGAKERGLLPAGAVEEIEHTRERFLAPDGTLLLPLVQHGQLSAVLVLQKHAARPEFPPDALATLEGIAGPLAVTLENALLYERMEQHVAERTEELRSTQQKLVATARRAGMAEISTNVLHNVGNTLNSVNVSAQLMQGRLAQTRIGNLSRAMDLLESRRGDLAAYLESDERGRILPDYLRELAEALQQERRELQGHLDHLIASIDHIKNVVATQQAYAGPSLLTETVLPGQLVDDALRICSLPAAGDALEVVKEIDDVPTVRLDKTRALQILVNLVDNARQAIARASSRAGKLVIQVEAVESRLRFRVRDTGCGIAPGDLTRIFSHGFTGRVGGHGFGLHSCALAATEMGGTLTVASDGLGKGATFTLELPLVASQGAREQPAKMPG